MLFFAELSFAIALLTAVILVAAYEKIRFHGTLIFIIVLALGSGFYFCSLYNMDQEVLQSKRETKRWTKILDDDASSNSLINDDDEASEETSSSEPVDPNATPESVIASGKLTSQFTYNLADLSVDEIQQAIDNQYEVQVDGVFQRYFSEAGDFGLEDGDIAYGADVAYVKFLTPIPALAELNGNKYAGSQFITLIDRGGANHDHTHGAKSYHFEGTLHYGSEPNGDELYLDGFFTGNYE